MADSRSLASRAVGAGAWTVGTRLAAKLIDLLMLMCLARFLGPAEFGLVAMAMAAVLIVEALFDLPMAAALIRVPDVTQDMLHTAFTLSLLRGLVVALLLVAVSLPLASFNNEPRLTALLVVLSLAPAMRGLVSPRMVDFARVLNFRPDAVMELSGKVVALVVSVGIAVTTRSYWAIAAATVCAPLVSTLLSYVFAPLRPRLTLARWAHFSSLTSWNFVAQLGSALNWQIDRLLLPRLISTTAFGQYAMGKQLAEIPFQALLQPLVRPVMPALANAGDGRAKRYLQFSHAIALVMTPIIGLAVLWPEALVRVGLGADWAPAAQWLRWSSAIALISVPSMLLGPLAMVMDRTRWLAVRTLVELLFRAALVWFGAVQFGIAGAIGGAAIANLVGTLATLAIVRRLIRTSLLAQLTTLGRPLLAMLPAGALLWLTRPLLAAAENVTQVLAWAVPLGILYLLVYALSALLAWHLAGRPPGLEQHLFEMVRGRAARARARHAATRAHPTPDRAMESHVK